MTRKASLCTSISWYQLIVNLNCEFRGENTGIGRSVISSVTVGGNKDIHKEPLGL